MRVASLVPGGTDRYTESEAWHARLEGSLGFEGYKGTGNRAGLSTKHIERRTIRGLMLEPWDTAAF